ncbi:MAG TPA: DinB family protein [Pyrinomonadaceae bacterium]
MNLQFFVARLAANAKALESLCQHASDEQALWKQSPERWSIHQVVYHLAQTEEKDFRPRLEKTLRAPEENWQPLVASEMRLEKAGGANNLNESLRNFLVEREKSIVWLETIENANWENSHRHNEQLTLAAGDLLASWLAHDYLHIKQIIRLQYDYVNSISAPFKTDYAGKWS